MDNLCNNCIHKDICARRMATWGMKSCEHFKEERKGRWIAWKEIFPKAIFKRLRKGFCSYCGALRIKDNFCSNCGADMRGKEDG